jgi:hypothetical protein
MILFGLLLALGLGAITGAVASGKGRSFLAWFIGGALLAIVFLPLALLIQPETAALTEARAITSGEAVRCPHCAEIVRPEARVCKHCGRDIAPQIALTAALGNEPVP